MRGLAIPGAQQYGGASWWRPSVVRLDGQYHGFFVVNQGQGYNVVHYVSSNLTDWSLAEIIDGDTGFDSVVFRLGNGTWVLQSATDSQGRLAGQIFLSPTLLAGPNPWTPAAPGSPLYFPTGEGPHVLNYSGYLWHNSEVSSWDYRPSPTAGLHTIRLMRSGDGGQTWVNATDGKSNLFDDDCTGCSQRFLDGGVPHQGPILLTAGGAAASSCLQQRCAASSTGVCSPSTLAWLVNSTGPGLFSLFFDEFNMTWPSNDGTPMGVPLFGGRSVLQVASVQYVPSGGTGNGPYLVANRSTPFDWYMAPPQDVVFGSDDGSCVSNSPIPAPAWPAVWHVSSVDAMVIALAEANRWYPGLNGISYGPLQTQPVQGYRLSQGFYTAQQEDTVQACVSACQAAAPSCSAVVFKEPQTGGGAAPCGSVGQGCCYMLPYCSNPVNCTGVFADGWDSWAVGGLYPHYRVQGWRDPTVASRYFYDVTSSGADPDWTWHLAMHIPAANTSGIPSVSAPEYPSFVSLDPLWLNVTVAGNGAITAMVDGVTGVAYSPLKQFRRDPPLTYEWMG